MRKELDTYQKAIKVQNMFDDLQLYYKTDSMPKTDAYLMAKEARNKVHALSNASLARLYDIMQMTFGLTPLSFEEFRMTEKLVDQSDKDFAECYGIDEGDTSSGYKYVDRYFIQFLPETKEYYLVLSNQQWVNRDRAVIEKILYQKEYVPNFICQG